VASSSSLANQRALAQVERELDAFALAVAVAVAVAESYDARPPLRRDEFSGLGAVIGRDGGGIVFHSLRHTFGTQMACPQVCRSS